MKVNLPTAIGRNARPDLKLASGHRGLPGHGRQRGGLAGSREADGAAGRRLPRQQAEPPRQARSSFFSARRGGQREQDQTNEGACCAHRFSSVRFGDVSSGWPIVSNA